MNHWNGILTTLFLSIVTFSGSDPSDFPVSIDVSVSVVLLLEKEKS